MVHLRLVFAALLALCVGFSRDVAAHSCDGTIVDQTWTGVRAAFGSLATDRYAFIAYYNAGRQFTVARIDLKSCVVERKRLPSVFNGWDSHNYTAIALDPEGRLHVAGNMHVDPLIYFHGREPLNIESIEPASMIGRDEDRVTYPRFVDVRGHFSFVYRAGRAGDGEWLINEWTGDGWRRLIKKPIFGDGSGGVTASAYPSPFHVGPDGFFHVAVVWRGSLDAQSNFRLSYAKSQDFRTWFDHAGQAIPVPLAPDTMDTIGDVGRHKGLLNNAKVSVGDDGTPYVTYTKYTESGRNGVYLARPEGNAWRSELLAESEKTTPIEGKGTLRRIPRFSAVRFVKDGAIINVQFPDERSVRVRLKERSSSNDVAAGRFGGFKTHSAFASVLPRLIRPTIMTSHPKDKRAQIQFSWVAQAFDRKTAQRCRRDVSPAQCNPPPSPLILQERAP